MCPEISIPMNNINIEDLNVSDNEDNLHIISDSLFAFHKQKKFKINIKTKQ